MTTLPRIASLVFNRPHYITRDAGLAIANAVTRGGLGSLAPEASRFVGEEQVERDEDGRPITDAWGNKIRRGFRRQGSTAIVNVLGELVNRGAWLDARSGLVSYEGFAQQLRAVSSEVAAGRVRALILDVNSPGGEAAGMTDAADLVRALAAEIPVVAVANSMMCSAAYGICSGATRIVTTELGVVGSIGVVMMHADYSGALGKSGIDVTLIHEGAHKVDGNPFEALPADVRDAFQAECAKYYAAFVGCVAAGRRSLSPAGIRATEART
ncbi:MAG TPA: S49 family peptidase, partial [Hyphomicrobiaceae bacterium]|nr:S49 family peptidase [Hyphomicrobiaceae bacterium]